MFVDFIAASDKFLPRGSVTNLVFESYDFQVDRHQFLNKLFGIYTPTDEFHRLRVSLRFQGAQFFLKRLNGFSKHGLLEPPYFALNLSDTALRNGE